MSSLSNKEIETRIGLGYAFAAFSFWGIVPVYFKIVHEVSPEEILAHRVVWTLTLALAILFVTGKLGTIRVALSSKKTLQILGGASILVAINWYTFVWAVVHDRVLETSLGYFINPLVTVLLGLVFLRERLRPAQTLAVVVAGAGVLCLIVGHGSLPWVCLVLPVAFGFYGLLKKQVNVDALAGMSIEMAALLPFALGYIAYLNWSGSSYLESQNWQMMAIMMAAGPVTLFPLACFAAAARRIQLTTIGFVQYIAPTISFLIAITAFGEPFGLTEVLTFALIWISLAIFTADGLRASRASKGPSVSAAEESA